ncbi:hypothetical protein DV515_00004554, partial [Chloebia gouldiae]
GYDNNNISNDSQSGMVKCLGRPPKLNSKLSSTSSDRYALITTRKRFIVPTKNCDLSSPRDAKKARLYPHHLLCSGQYGDCYIFFVLAFG